MKRIGGLVMMAVCIGVLSNCALPLGLSVRGDGSNAGDFRNSPDMKAGGGSVDSGVADVTATTARESQDQSEQSRAGGGVLPPLGEFDRTVPGFQVFDPCSASSVSAFEGRGLAFAGSVRRETGYRSCQFEAEDIDGSSASVSIESRDYNLTEIRSAFPMGIEVKGEKGESIYLVKETLVSNVTCTGYVETVQGTLSVSWTNFSDAISIVDNCKNVERVIGSVI